MPWFCLDKWHFEVLAVLPQHIVIGANWDAPGPLSLLNYLLWQRGVTSAADLMGCIDDTIASIWRTSDEQVGASQKFGSIGTQYITHRIPRNE